MRELFLVAFMGSLGALLRYHLGGYVHSAANRAMASERDIPFGTLFVNASGSFLLGLITGLVSQGACPYIYSVAIGAGFCGSLTTFSTLAVDLQRLLRDRCFLLFVLTLLISTGSGIGAVLSGLALSWIVR